MSYNTSHSHKPLAHEHQARRGLSEQTLQAWWHSKQWGYTVTAIPSIPLPRQNNAMTKEESTSKELFRRQPPMQVHPRKRCLRAPVPALWVESLSMTIDCHRHNLPPPNRTRKLINSNLFQSCYVQQPARPKTPTTFA
jgi:hypothetical protein